MDNSVPMLGFCGELIKIYFLIWNWRYVRVSQYCYVNSVVWYQWSKTKSNYTQCRRFHQNWNLKWPGLTYSGQGKVGLSWLASFGLGITWWWNLARVQKSMGYMTVFFFFLLFLLAIFKIIIKSNAQSLCRVT